MKIAVESSSMGRFRENSYLTFPPATPHDLTSCPEILEPHTGMFTSGLNSLNVLVSDILPIAIVVFDWLRVDMFQKLRLLRSATNPK